MTQLTKAAFDIQTEVLFPTNGVGAISALDLRTQFNNLADSVPFKLTGKTSAPTANDDVDNTGGNGATQIGDIWVNEVTNQVYICLDNSIGAAIWANITSGGGGGGLVDGDYGDITISASGTVLTINPTVVTYDKIQDVTNGSLLGRMSETDGTVMELDSITVRDFLGITASPYDLRFGFTATPTSDEVIDTIMIPRDLILPDNLLGSLGRVGVNPTASFAMLLQDDGVTIATITISTLGAFTFSTVGGLDQTVLTGSVLTLVAPTGVDATVANMTMTILGSI